jgi:hypothetical protein
MSDDITFLWGKAWRITEQEHKAMLTKIESLRAENAKLRAALQSIIDQEAETVCLWDAQQIARDALKD